MGIILNASFAAVLLIQLSIAVQAQVQAGSAPLRFEVASIKTNSENRIGGGGDCRAIDTKATRGTIPLGRCLYRHVTLADLLFRAYPSPYVGYLSREDLVTGGPSWMRTASFDVEATAEDPLNTNGDQLRQMFQTLLKETFHLSLEERTKAVFGYFLVPAKSGIRLKVYTGPPGPRPPVPGMKLFPSPYGTIRQLTKVLTLQFKAIVVDKTGIEGGAEYDFRALPNIEDERNGSLISALRDELGLEMKPQRIPVGVIFVAHAEKPNPKNR